MIEAVSYPPSRELGNEATGVIERLNVGLSPIVQAPRKPPESLRDPGKKDALFPLPSMDGIKLPSNTACENSEFNLFLFKGNQGKLYFLFTGVYRLR